jgi:hypothetical protein
MWIQGKLVGIVAWHQYLAVKIDDEKLAGKVRSVQINNHNNIFYTNPAKISMVPHFLSVNLREKFRRKFHVKNRHQTENIESFEMKNNNNILCILNIRCLLWLMWTDWAKFHLMIKLLKNNKTLYLITLAESSKMFSFTLLSKNIFNESQ